jgi:uncharacterized protein (TIGR03067 family)
MSAHLLLGLLLTLEAPAPSAKADVDIEGDWVIESWFENGQFDNVWVGLVMTFRDGRVTTVGVAGTYAVLAARGPRAIDLRDGEDSLFRAIYKVEGRALTLCMSREAEGPRPAWFTAERRDPFQLLVLKRTKK